MHALETVVNAVNGILWNNILIYLLVGVGIFFTFRLKFIQVRGFFSGMKMFFSGVSLKGEKAGKNGMSSFQAVATAIAGQVGTGNLAGPATAIILGGPGALFWIWVSSFLGMATIYAEAILAIHFKTKDRNGQVVGGPAYYIERGLGMKWLAVLFAVLIIMALGLIGNMVQSNSIVEAFSNSFNTPTWLMGLILASITGLVIMGGIKNIAAVVEKLIPLMALFYLLGVVVILTINSAYLWDACRVIFVAAFDPEAVLGAGAGIAIQQAARFGIARGLFSNEAGMGSTPHAHAVAKDTAPEQQAFLAMMGVFIVCTIVTLTGFVIITSALKDWAALGNVIGQGNFLSIYQVKGIAVTQQAYQSVFGAFGGYFVSIALLCFAFSTIVGWYYYAETNVRYLFGSEVAIRIFQMMVVACIFIAAFFKVDLVWDMADMFNGLMVLPNILALILLSTIVVKITKAAQKK
ncbi:alanine/glycine:cation symporter family protein [Wohlfahrtiimonas chitiniclastica]|uniref:alanine/glycine:cation symporter family protein n=1 Tax=Wohlfahrtiimonas chitiniclastica TaxID=400946 RepID=UPI001BCB5A40|nr:sodium:alanine symporter family protein [Wohlfahrtiimonas chitiniclastica]MBS7814848.1 sodium:alanine symporter family protein [Wohlfahrtiimonas chitiniclastica]MBS7816977.1 sodium:alanine symporter family protein [Wohlfahrtiimonas chitiniclastica]MBS7822819.1 sodium:alanine symporter family protein [Wohlfahrtiimonas chitiniclastica]MBS7830633.1 sodium:alanine symporter family protein [Wohlfahrtiimonas chitiniclastica]MBS7832539.1 sodium:alanine symporter family protein [Wohlfahrtiimonas ch